jgi:hypothetical protein
MPAPLVHGYGRLLLILTLAFALLAVANLLGNPIPETQAPHAELLSRAGWLLAFFVLPGLAWPALRRVRSPAPSTSGPALLGLCLAAILSQLAQILARH